MGLFQPAVSAHGTGGLAVGRLPQATPKGSVRTAEAAYVAANWGKAGFFGFGSREFIFIFQMTGTSRLPTPTRRLTIHRT